MSEFCNVEWRPTTAADRVVRCVIPAGVPHETHRSDEGYQMRDMSQSAPPSREAEIAADYEKGLAPSLADMAYLLAQLQQARQERDALDGKLTFNEQGYRLVQAHFEAAERRAEAAEAALQQAREALKKFGRHGDKCVFSPNVLASTRPEVCTCGLDAALKNEGR